MSVTTVAADLDKGRPVSDHVLQHLHGDGRAALLAEQAEQRGSALWLDIAAPLDLASGQFPVPDSISYDLERGEVGLVLDGLVTCFDHATVSPSSVRFIALDISGFPVIDSEIQELLAYLPSMSTLSYDNRPNKACFWKNQETGSGVNELALFGRVEPVDETLVFSDRFEVPPDQATASVSLNVFAIDDDGVAMPMPEQASVGEKITYRIVIENTGARDIDNLGVQELFVNNSFAAPALLKFVQDSMTCTSSGGASCGALPKEIEMPGFPGDFVQLPYLRGDHDDGLALPIGSGITFEVTRKIETGRDDSGIHLPPGEVVGEFIDLSFVAVALDGIDLMPANETLQHRIEVIAEGGLQADPSSAEPTAGDTQDVTVQVVDESLEPVAWDGIEIAAQVIDGEAEFVGADVIATNGAGQAVFEFLSTTANTVSVEFTAEAVTESGQPAVTLATLEFQAGPVTALRFEDADDFPESFQLGQTLPDLVVSGIDQFGNVSSSLDGSSVQLNLLEQEQFVHGWVDDREDLLAGQVVFSGLELPGTFSGTGFSLRATRGSDAAGDSPEFAIIEAQPTSP